MPVLPPAEELPPSSTDEFVSSIHLHPPAPHPLCEGGNPSGTSMFAETNQCQVGLIRPAFGAPTRRPLQRSRHRMQTRTRCRPRPSPLVTCRSDSHLQPN